jgi:transposase InsO family protein
MDRPDGDVGLLAMIRDAFERNRRCGYKRIHLEPRGAGVIVSAKRIMRLMTGNGIVSPSRSSRRHSSCMGEIGTAPGDLVARDFHAVSPNRLWVTDITGTAIPAGKVHLPPVIDCCDDMPVSWTVGAGPNALLANTMLQRACTTLKPGETPTIHSDRGCHCRWPGWPRICREYGLTRSMSAKGRSPDNAAAEGFLGRLEQGFHHERDFTGMGIDRFMAALDEYLVWYRDERIKTRFGMSITDKRRELGLMA